MFRLGVTGGIGSGKTTVSKMLEKFGAYVFDADFEAKKIIAEELLAEISEIFGKNFIDENGNLKRREFAEFVFSDKEKTQKLNSLVHPKVRLASKKAVLKAEKEGFLFFVHNAPLIFEAGIEKELDAVLVVAVTEKVALKRTILRDKITESEVKLRISRQMPLEEKIKRANFVLWNNGTLEEVEKSVCDFYEKTLKELV